LYQPPASAGRLITNYFLINQYLQQMEQQSKTYIIILAGCLPQLIQIPAAMDAVFLKHFKRYVYSVSDDYFEANKLYAILMEDIYKKRQQ
jgi:hypothetical protein